MCRGAERLYREGRGEGYQFLIDNYIVFARQTMTFLMNLLPGKDVAFVISHSNVIRVRIYSNSNRIRRYNFSIWIFSKIILA